MTLSETEISALTAPREAPWPLADLEALVAAWRQLREWQGAPAPTLAVADHARLAARLEGLRLGEPPEGSAEEVVTVWRRHAASWAAAGPVEALRRDLDELVAEMDEDEAEQARRVADIELLQARCTALAALADLLDGLLASAPASNETEPGGEP